VLKKIYVKACLFLCPNTPPFEPAFHPAIDFDPGIGTEDATLISLGTKDGNIYLIMKNGSAVLSVFVTNQNLCRQPITLHF
jgi:hypothetical protein